jgi:hypothetical protein
MEKNEQLFYHWNEYIYTWDGGAAYGRGGNRRVRTPTMSVVVATP